MQKNFFAADAVFVSEQTNQYEVLKESYDRLRELDYVKGDFLSQVVKRENEYPTGIDTSNLDKNLPNIALPHTEGRFVNTTLIVPIKLANNVVFHNMVRPQEELSVNFLFMLLDASPDGQAKLQAKVVGFLAHTQARQLATFFNLTEPEAIYEFLKQRF